MFNGRVQRIVALAGINPTHQLLDWDHRESAFNVFGHGYIHGVVWCQVNLSHQLSWECYLTIGADLDRTVRRLHQHQTT